MARVRNFSPGLNPCACSHATRNPAPMGITQRKGMASSPSCSPVARPPPRWRSCGVQQRECEGGGVTAAQGKEGGRRAT
jgi:hypothetical protein